MDVAPSPTAPRVSIVLPVYNGERYLAAAIDSIRAQTFGDFELICVDDGSRDASGAMLAAAAAADPRIRVIVNDPNRGLPASLNIGFAAARGTLHSWTSHDNELRPHMLARLVGTFDAYPETDVVYAGFTVIDAAGRPGRRGHPDPVEERFFGNMVGAAFLYRAAVWNASGGYDETLFGAEDYDFWLRAARRFTFRALDEDLYLYRRHDDSLTDQRERQIKDMVEGLMMRELAFVDDRTVRARAKLELFLNDARRPRFGPLFGALRDDPAYVASRAPALARWLPRFLLRR